MLLVVMVSGSSAFARADATAQRRSALFYRQAQAARATQADRLLRQAAARVREAMRTAPGDFRTLCERTRSLRFAVDNEAARAGRRRALATLARQALERRAYLDDALARLDRALALDPDNPALVETRARVLALWEEPRSLDDCQVRRKDAQAIEAFERLQQLDPTFEASEVAFQLGLLRTRTHAFEAAAAAYARAVELAFDARDTAAAHGNLAEVIMVAGDPGAALVHYERALKLTQAGRDYALVLFGAAVALDRLGEHEVALQRASAAVDAAGRSLSILRAPGVFFEPDYELQYYEGLGHEALARLLPESGALALESAASSYRAFLESAPLDNPYRVSAQANLDAVETALQIALAEPKSGPAKPRSTR
jgi:tetratricopeptide (TPR) repeat protein